MPKIKMLKTEAGYDCDKDGRGHPMKVYRADEEYEVGERLAKDFQNLRVAVLVGAEIQDKLEKGAKAKGRSPENKGV